MPHLLLILNANRTMNKTVFVHKLQIYDNKMVFHARKYIFNVTEVTISYNHVAQVYLTKGVFFATLEIINTGGTKDIVIKYVPKKQAEQAKRIIDAKIHDIKDESFVGKKSKEGVNTIKKSNYIQEIQMDAIEVQLSRLEELRVRNRITKKEYNKKRKAILQNMK